MIMITILKLRNLIISENFTARLKQANLASKSDAANFIKKTILKINQKKLID